MFDETKRRLVDDWLPTGGILYYSVINGFVQYWGYSYTDKNVDMDNYSPIVLPYNIICSNRGYRSETLDYLEHKVVTPLMFFKGNRQVVDSNTIDHLNGLIKMYNVDYVIHYIHDKSIVPANIIKTDATYYLETASVEEIAFNNKLIIESYPIEVKKLLDWYVHTLHNRLKYIQSDYHVFFTVDEYWPEWRIKKGYFDAPHRFINPDVCKSWGSALIMAQVDKEDDDDKVTDIEDRNVCSVINPRFTHEEDLEENMNLGSTGAGVSAWCISGGGFPDWMSTPWGRTAGRNDGTILLYTDKDYNALSRKTVYDFHNFIIGSGSPHDEYPVITNLRNETMFDKLWAPHISHNAKYASDMFTIVNQDEYVDITEAFGKKIPSGINKGALKVKTNIDNGIYLKSDKLNIDGVATFDNGLPNLSYGKHNKRIESIRLYVSESDYFSDEKRDLKLRSANIILIGSEFMVASTDIGLNRFDNTKSAELRNKYKEFPFTDSLYKAFEKEYKHIVEYSNINDYSESKIDSGLVLVDWNAMGSAEYGEGVVNIPMK